MNCDGVSNLLSAYLDGELNPGELLRVEEHLRRCHACADEVDSLRQTIALVSSLEEVEVPANFGFQLHQRLVALGPPVAAVRRTPAAPSWQRNVRRWAVPAAAAAAALAIGLTSFDQVADKLPGGLKSESSFNVAPPPKTVETSATSGTVAGNDAGTQIQPPPVQPFVQPPVDKPKDPPPLKPADPGKLTATPGGPVGAGTPDVTDTTKATGKYVEYSSTITVKGALDPKVEENVRKENARVEKAENTLTIYVPSSGYQQWLDGVVKLFPGAEVKTSAVPLDTEIALAGERVEAATRQRDQNLKESGPDREAVLAAAEKALAEAKSDLEFLTERANRGTIIVKFVAP